MVRLYRYIVLKIDRYPWFGRAGTDYNPDDTATRHVALPRHIGKSLQFPKLATVFQLIRKKPRFSTARRIKATAITTL